MLQSKGNLCAHHDKRFYSRLYVYPPFLIFRLFFSPNLLGNLFVTTFVLYFIHIYMTPKTLALSFLTVLPSPDESYLSLCARDTKYLVRGQSELLDRPLYLGMFKVFFFYI